VTRPLPRTSSEIAWAAGFFEGEGHARCDVQGAARLRLAVRQKYRRPLERFARIVEGGRVHGPYDHPACYTWQVGGRDAARIARLLAPYLTPRGYRAEQVARAVGQWEQARARTQLRDVSRVSA
jgi:hypothetical protein